MEKMGSQESSKDREIEEQIKKFEREREKIPSKEQVLAFLGNIEGLWLHAIYFDEKGLVLLEARKDAGQGEIISFEYVRKGTHVIPNESRPARSLNNNINVTYYTEGVPTGGTTYAVFDEETGSWKLV